MKKFLLLTLTIVVACATAMAAPVDAVKAQQKATQFLTSQASPLKNVMPSDMNATLIKTEMGEKATTPVYYIFNTTSTFVIVSGDDRAEDILFVGDAPLNLDRMPENMKAWLDGYKEQLDWLLCNPDAKVEKTSTMMKGASLKAISDVSPMLTCNWDQSAPYYNQCSFTYSNRTYQCVTGCPATSASMVMYYWKYPTTQVGPLASYIAELDLSYYNIVSSYSYPSLPATTFDWANMKDNYTGSYTTAEGNAVATLMRYVGQAEKMMYGTSAAGGSGIYTTDTQNIVDMFTGFGYDASTCRVVNKSSYSETNWANLLQTEMAEGRPIVFTATTTSGAGHAFNVDGFRNSDTKYHINWGWSGEGNGYCAMNAFSTGTSSSGVSGGSYTFNQGQQMVIGIQPPASAFGPSLNVDASSLSFTSAGQSKMIALTGSNLTSDVTVALNDPSDAFNLNIVGLNASNSPMLKGTTTQTIPAASISADNPVNIIVTLKEGKQGTFNGTLTLSTTGADPVSVSLTATAGVEDTGGTASDAYLNIAKYATIDEAGWNSTATGYVTKFYEYNEYPSDGVAWLTMPVFGAWCGHRYPSNNGPQKWIKYNRDSSSDGYSTVGGVSTAWSADGIYKGSSAYYNGKTVRRFGNAGTSNSAYTEYALSFYVTNATAVKLKGTNGSRISTRYPTTLKVYECTKNGDALSEGSSTISGGNLSNTSATDFEFAVALEAGKIYKVVASVYRGNFTEIAFATPLPLPKTPVIVSAEPGSTTADITWIGGDNNEFWNLRYRPYTEPTMETISWDFNTEDQFDDWAILDIDSDGHYWGGIQLNEDGEPNDYAFCSESYVNGTGAVNPDNWLISPEIQFGGEVSFYAWGLDPDWAAEVFNVLVAPSSAISGTSVSTGQFVSITPDITTTGTKTKYTFDLSAYEGSGYFVIQHHNVTNQFVLVIDDVEVKYPAANQTQAEWIYVNGVTSPYTIEGLTPETTYEVQVQGGNAEYGTSSWTSSTLFTTLNGVGVPTIVSADPGSTTADITWTPGENNVGWNMRYRPYVDATVESTLWDIPLDGYQQQIADFSVYDADGDGDYWGLYYSSDAQTDLCFISFSYDPDNKTDLTPDNRLYTPTVTLGGTLKFKTCVYSTNYPDKIGVYVLPDNDEYAYLLQDISPQSNYPNFIEYEIDLSEYEGTGQIMFRHYESDGNIAILIDDIEVISPGPELAEWIYVNDVESPYTITGLTPETTYEVQVQGTQDNYQSAWTPSTIFTTSSIVDATLAYIESTGKKGETYTISDELIAVYANPEMGILWCKDQGTSDQPITSLLPTYIKDGQIDYMRDVAGEQKEDWDQSNWVAIKFPEATSNNTNSFLTAAVGKKIAAGTITGKYIDNRNYTIEVLPNENNEYIITPSGDSDYPMNVYCTANFLETNLNLTADSQGAPGVRHGQPAFFFFMNPKIQEVCKITYAEWNGSKFVVPADDDSQIPGEFTPDWSRNGQTPTLQIGHIYQFIATVNRPSTSGMLKADQSNIVVMPLNLTGGEENDVPTGINTVGMDNREVVAVEYVNSLGLTSKKPFHGVNIVVTRYSDGTKTTVKKIFK